MDRRALERVWEIMKVFNLEIVDDTSSLYKCIICNRTLINACNAPCGCRFCMDCIADYLKEGKLKCPGQSPICDKDVLDMDTNIQINKPINVRILKMQAKCPNRDCKIEIEVENIDNHLKTCKYPSERCPYLYVGCKKDILPENSIQNHLEHETYQHTQMLINYVYDSRREIQHLNKSLGKLKKSHEMEQEKDFLNISNEIALMKEHIMRLKEENESINNKVQSNKDKYEHTIELLMEQVQKDKKEIELLNDEMGAMKNSNRTLIYSNGTIKETMDKQLKDLQEAKDEIKRLTQAYEKSENQFQEIRTKLNNITINTNASMVEAIPQTNQPIDKVDDDSKQTEFEWKIKDWTKKSKKVRTKKIIDEKIIYSDEFYSHRNGYKMCLVAEIDAREVEFKICIVKGDFDNNLQWPFQRHVSISLMDQSTGNPFKTWPVDLVFHTLKAFKKPSKNYRNDPHCVGEISLRKLDRNPELTLHDMIVIKCLVKPLEPDNDLDTDTDIDTDTSVKTSDSS